MTLLNVRGHNRLIDLLPAADRERVLSGMSRRESSYGEAVFERNEPIRQVVFPLTAIVSMVVIMQDGATIEAGTVGNEGMAGLPLVLGAQSMPNRAFIQVAGEALWMPARALQEELGRRGALFDLLHRYAQSFVVQVSQAAACNRVHPVEQRLCRWILMSQDRTGSDSLALTQEVLAQMLGVRRPSVTIAANMLQKAGFIRYSRGKVTVIDRAGLEESCCECYHVVRTESERLLS